MAVLSAAIATPLRAQQAMPEPAYCAFFYPNANCQNEGPGNPYIDPNYHRAADRNTECGRPERPSPLPENGRGRTDPPPLRRACNNDYV